MATKKKTTNNSTTKKEKVVKVEKEEVRKIRPKNYIILGAIFLATFALVFLLRFWYNAYRDYKLTIPVLKGTLNEVTLAELDHYITANPDAVIYIEVSEDENSREVAKDLKNVIKERNLANKVVYINISSEEDKTITLLLIFSSLTNFLITLAKGSLTVFLISTISNLEGSSLLPVPILEIKLIPLFKHSFITHFLTITVSHASTKKSIS